MLAPVSGQVAALALVPVPEKELVLALGLARGTVLAWEPVLARGPVQAWEREQVWEGVERVTALGQVSVQA